MSKSLKSVWFDHSPPGWLPDWRYADEYPDVKNAHKHDFAWEFLRRNPEYQRDYIAINKLCSAEEVQDRYKNSLGFNIFPQMFLPRSFKAPKLYDKRDGRFLCVLVPHIPPAICEPDVVKSVKFHTRLSEILTKWGLSFYLLDPVYDFRETADFGMLRRIGPFIHSMEVVSCEDVVASVDDGILPAEYEVPYLFDLTLPIDPQVKRAKALLNVEQKRLSCKKTQASNTAQNNFVLYLQVLDADASGVDDAVIRNSLFSKEVLSEYTKNSRTSPRARKLGTVRRGAYNLLNGGYKLLL